MKLILSIATIVLVTIFALFDADPCRGEENKILAEVGKQKISSEDFMDIVILYRKSGDLKKLSETLSAEGKERILSELIEIKLLSLKARERGIDKDPAVRRSIEFTIDSMLAQGLIEWEIDRLDLSEAGLHRYYNLNPEEFMTGKRAKSRHIVTKTREEAENALLTLRDHGDFGKVAAEKNIDSTKQSGGDLGWVVRGIMVEPFEDALFSLKPGEISEIVETSFGFHIVKVEEIDEGKLQDFDFIKEAVKEKIIDDHINELKAELRKKYPVIIDTEKLKRFEK